MKRATVVLAVLVITSCAGGADEPPELTSEQLDALVVRTDPIPPPPRIELPPPAPPPLIQLPPDTCGARDLQYLVGQPRTEIPVPVDTTNRRVTCSSCPVTQDYREERLNIFFNADSGIVEQVTCG